MSLCIYLITKKGRNLPQIIREIVERSVKNTFPHSSPFTGRNIWQSACKKILAYEFYSPVTTLKCESKRDVFFSVSGYLDADNEQLQKVATYSSQQRQDFMRNCSGLFSIIFANEREQVVSAYVPFHGGERLFYGEHQDFYVVSNRALPICFLLHDTIKYNLMNFFGYLNTSGMCAHFTFDDTPFEGVKSMLPGSELTFNTSEMQMTLYDHYQQNWQQTEVNHNVLFDGMAQALIDHFSLIKKLRYKVRINITGGKDSRLLLAVATHLGLDIEAFTFGAPHTNDMIIGKKICKYLNIPHKHKSWVSENSDVTIDMNKYLNETLFISEGMLNGIFPYKATYAGSVKNISIAGWGSGILKRYESYNRHSFKSLINNFLMDVIPYMRKEKVKSYQNRINNWIEDNHISNNKELINSLCFEHTSRLEAAMISSFRFMGGTMRMVPFYDIRFSRLCMKIPQHFMVHSHYPIYEMIRRFNDKLLQFPLGNNAWKLPEDISLPKQMDIKLYPQNEGQSKPYRNINNEVIKTFVYNEIFNKSYGNEIFDLCRRRKVRRLFKKNALNFTQISFLWRLLSVKKTLANEWITNDFQSVNLKFKHQYTQLNKDKFSVELLT